MKTPSVVFTVLLVNIPTSVWSSASTWDIRVGMLGCGWVRDVRMLGGFGMQGCAVYGEGGNVCGVGVGMLEKKNVGCRANKHVSGNGGETR
jgi:hypothetical protein